ncbi:SusD/RagB family nutrient-binding outer membrane lipoprotein, partial [Phocaeicola vulgatus]
EYLTEGCRLSAYVYDKAAELNQVPYYSRTCVNDPLDATIKIDDTMVNEMLSHDAFKLTGDTKSDLEKVYIQQYIHYIMSPLDQFINVRRSGIPMKNSTLLPWEEFSDLLDYSTLIPRRFKVSEPAPTDQMRDITIAAYKAQGFSYGTDNADPDKLNSQRVWVDEGNPQFGEGPNLN